MPSRTIAARHVPHSAPSESPLDPDLVEDPFLATQGTGPQSQISPITGLPYSVSSPKVAQLFNIFHPSDPISYRMEPLISPVMSSLKPQQLPYTKKGFLSSAPQGLTAIGTKVSGLWSSLSATIPRNVLTRKLGLTSEDLANLDAQQKEASSASSDEKKKQLAEGVESADQKQSGQGKTPDDPILIDDEMETLYQKFQQKHADLLSAKKDENGGDGNDGDEGDRPKRLAEKLRSEEAKIRALNRNGRVDYSIQESMMDFNPISTIASHMSYWSDEDVSHFIISQLLSRRSDAAKK